jgi:hypothetical protein
MTVPPLPASSWATQVLWVLLVLVAVVRFFAWLPLKLLALVANWRRFFRSVT